MQNLFEKIDDIFRRFYDEQRLPSLSVGVVHAGQIVHSLQLVAEGHPKVSVNSVYGIASMAKSFVGAAFLVLRDRGAIQFHEPVTKFLPFLRRDVRWERVTIFHLLTMQSGLPEDNAWGDRQLELTDDGYTALFEKSLDEEIVFHASPGEQIIYSNFGYFLLGRILSIVSGEHALDFITENLLIPLGMKNSAWTADTLPIELVLNGFGPRGERVSIPRSVGDGAVFGGLLSSSADMCLWMDFIMDDSADRYLNILKRESRAELRSGHGVVPTDSAHLLPIAYGYGVANEYSETLKVWKCYHSGGIPGYGSHMQFSPRHQFGVVALANKTYAPVRAACAQAVELACAEIPQVSWPTNRLVQTRYHEMLQLIGDWSDTLADQIFASNFFMDTERGEAQAMFAKIKTELGEGVPELEFDRELKGHIRTQGKRLATFSLAPVEHGRIQQVIL